MEIDLFHIQAHIPRAYEVDGDVIRVRDPFFKWDFTCTSLGLTRADVIAGLRRMQAGETVQVCFPTLSADQREAFVTNPAIWEQMAEAKAESGDK